MSNWGVMAAEQLSWGSMMEEGWRKGPWTAEEDRLLIEYVKLHGEGRWNSVARLAGLKRNGKSCRLRWVNYLRPDLKRGQITPNEEKVIIELHARWGNRWSTIARSLPGRTDNEIKNYWRTHFKKKVKGGSSDNSEKSKARLLRRQHFQQQQQQQHHQQQQTQLFDMKKFMSLLDETDSRVPILPQMIKQDSAAAAATTNTFPNSADDHQIFVYSMFNNYATVAETANHEDIIWDGLWNLDDHHVNGNINCSIATNKASLHASAYNPFYY